jgi:hypothetical protein
MRAKLKNGFIKNCVFTPGNTWIEVPDGEKEVYKKLGFEFESPPKVDENSGEKFELEPDEKIETIKIKRPKP